MSPGCSNENRRESSLTPCSRSTLDQQIETVCFELPIHIKKCLHDLRELDFKATQLEKSLYSDCEYVKTMAPASSASMLINEVQETGNDVRKVLPFSFKIEYDMAVEVFKNLSNIHDERVQICHSLYHKLQNHIRKFVGCDGAELLKEIGVKKLLESDDDVENEEIDVLEFVVKASPVKRHTSTAANNVNNNKSGNRKGKRARCSKNASETKQIRQEEEEKDDQIEKSQYCICKRVVNSNMIQCDSGFCSIDWFHLVCLGMSERQVPEGEWICPKCIVDPRYTIAQKKNNNAQ